MTQKLQVPEPVRLHLYRVSEIPDGLVLLQSAGVYTQLDVATIVGSLELFRDKLYFMSFFIFMVIHCKINWGLSLFQKKWRVLYGCPIRNNYILLLGFYIFTLMYKSIYVRSYLCQVPEPVRLYLYQVPEPVFMLGLFPKYFESAITSLLSISSIFHYLMIILFTPLNMII